LALQKYREYLGLKPSAEDAESIALIVRQLEQQLTPPPHVAQTNQSIVPHALAQMNTNEPAPKTTPTENLRTNLQKPLVVESPRASTYSKPEPSNNAMRTGPASDGSKTNPVLVANNVEVVKLAPEPVLKAAEDMPIAADMQSSSDPLPTNSSPAALAARKSGKRTFLQRINPLSLFSSDGKSAAHPEPTAASIPRSLQGTDASSELSGNGLERLPRYTYSSPSSPIAGNRTEAEPVFGRGVQAQQAQHLSEAVQQYQRAIELDPSFYDAQYNLGLAASQAGNTALALVAYETALVLRPESVDARYNFALALKQANYQVDAANELQKILASSPNEGRAHLALGNLYAQQFNDLTKARQHYLKVLEVEPHNPQADAIRYWLTRHPR